MSIFNFFKKKEEKVNCFFCKIAIDKDTAYVLKYNTIEGKFDNHICPMCEGMMEDIRKVYNNE